MRLRQRSALVARITEILVPILFLYALYVLFHGHYSPGGGFQSGVILSAAFLLQILTHGRSARPISYATAIQLGAAGLGLFALIGTASVALGGFYLDYSALPLAARDHPEMRRSLGILGIEIGVSLAVMMLTLCVYYALASVDPRELEDHP